MNHFIYYVLPGEDNPELRYSLRSLAANGPEDIKVSFVGSPPLWVDDSKVTIVEGNPYQDRFQNSLHNLQVACELEPGDFYTMNDDFFIMKPWPDELPVWFWQPIETHMKNSMKDPKSNPRKQVFARTLSYLRHKSIEIPMHYELHIPMLINGTEMLRILDEASDYINIENPPIWRTLYGNLSELTTLPHYSRMDVKHHSRYTIKDELDFLSTDENSFHRTRFLLESKFTEPSPWEK
ncbi:hypothetical protein SEA_BIG4_228 [Microbacterium phage Big4]|nr:hypothetical protein SEA_BIG4_228 [Microbacterium phage Big4]